MALYWGAQYISKSMHVLTLPCPNTTLTTTSGTLHNLCSMSALQIPFAHVLLEADQFTQKGLARWNDCQDEDYKRRLGAQSVLATEAADGQTINKYLKQELGEASKK